MKGSNANNFPLHFSRLTIWVQILIVALKQWICIQYRIWYVGVVKPTTSPFPFPLPPSLHSLPWIPLLSYLPFHGGCGGWQLIIYFLVVWILSPSLPHPSSIISFWFDWILSPPHPFPYLLLVLVWLNFIYTPFLIHYQFKFEFFLPFPRSLLCVSMKTVTHTHNRQIY